MSEELKKVLKRSEEVSDTRKARNKIVSSVNHAYRNLGNVSSFEFSEFINSKHSGYGKREWVAKCDGFISSASEKLREDFNSLIEKRFSSNVQVNVWMLVFIVLFGIYSLVPGLTGLVVLGGGNNIVVDQEFSSSSNLTIAIGDIGYLNLSGYVNRGFVGGVYLNDGTARYNVLDYSVSDLNESVENSSIVFSLSSTDVSSEVVGLNVESSFVDDSVVCTKWTIGSELVCYGSSSCCTYLGIDQEGDGWNTILYLNKGKWGVSDRNIVKAQVVYANYSLDIDNAYSDIRYSSIQGMVVDLFSSLDFASCGDACNIDSSADSYILEVVVESGSIYLQNYTYKQRLIPNSAPVFSIVPNITFAESYTLDLSAYVSDANGDSLEFTYFEADGVTISFDEMNAVISADSGFTGKTFTFFTANDSSTIGISNIIEINVVSNVSLVNVTVAEDEEFSPGYFRGPC